MVVSGRITHPRTSGLGKVYHPSSFPMPLPGYHQENQMLVLTRKLGEIIRIGDSIKISIVELRGGQVKLGIDAPSDIKVHREEIYARIQEEAQRIKPAAPGS